MSSLLDVAIDIWQAGVDAVRPERLFASKVALDGTCLVLDETELELASLRKLVIVGAGKASAAMAIAFHQQILSKLPAKLAELKIEGWINCPQGTATATLPNITLHEARPAGSNSPTKEAIVGTLRMLEMVAQTDHRDAVLCLLSGGGSALMVAPIAGLDLSDKQNVASVIAAAGGNIEQLNLVRRAISSVKGGGLARACRAGRLLTLVISDVPGDPLETIASGPTLLAAQADPRAALRVLEELGVARESSLTRVVAALQLRSLAPIETASDMVAADVEHIVLGNNADAVDAAGVRGVELGYRYVMQAAQRLEGDVLDVAFSATSAIGQLVSQRNIDCWISGGEPTVTLPKECGRGGRNQQLALAVFEQLLRQGWPDGWSAEVAFVGGGTDGEDGPTDAAGAVFDATVAHRARELGLDAASYLRRADAYRFFQAAGGLLLTGPTGTNVCDLRVALVRVS